MDNASQTAYIRDLAHQVRAIADSQENTARRKRWHDVNALRRPDRAPVLCRPVAAWNELIPEDTLRCVDVRLRGLEQEFRRILIKNDIGDDAVVLPFYSIEAVFDMDPPNQYGVDILRHEALAQGGAWGYTPALRDEEDFKRLAMPTYTYNRQKTEETRDFIDELLGDALPPKIVLSPYEPMTLGGPACDLRGMTELMMDCYENPDLLHRLMAYLRDITLSMLEQKLATGLLTPSAGLDLYASDELSPAPSETVTYKHCFGVGNSQEFDQVSPAMWEEFLLAYQKPIYERYGLAAYGCCENLTHKIDGVLSIPNLRVFVCSAWTDLDRVIDKTGRNYTIMWRQKASDVCFSDDIGVMKTSLENGCERLRGGFFQIVLRELQTLNGNKDRLHVWAELAKEAAAKFC